MSNLVFEYNGETVAINTKDFPSEKEEEVYQKYGLKALRFEGLVTLYNPEVWRPTNENDREVWGSDGPYSLQLIEDCLTPEQPFFTVAPCLQLGGVKDLSCWDVSSATNLCMMFDGCESLEELILDGWDISGVEGTVFMFQGCKNLKRLSLDGWYISEDVATTGMFTGCPAGSLVGYQIYTRATPCFVF